MIFPISSFKNDLFKDLSIRLIDGEKKKEKQLSETLKYSIKSSSTFIKITVSVFTLIKTHFSRVIETFFLPFFLSASFNFLRNLNSI